MLHIILYGIVIGVIFYGCILGLPFILSPMIRFFGERPKIALFLGLLWFIFIGILMAYDALE